MKTGRVLKSAVVDSPGIIETEGRRFEYCINDQAPGVSGIIVHDTAVSFDPGEEDGRRVARHVHPASARAPGNASFPATHKAPYTFVPVVIAGNEDAVPIFPAISHDGSDTGELLSGDLHIEITTLSPMLVGQHRYQHARITGGAEDFDPSKQMLEPALITEARTLVPPGTSLDRDGWRERRVLIPGESIKGALRANLSAMLNAPMERVAERHYSYRPNLEWPKNDDLRYQCREAIVTGENPRCVTILEAGRHAIFVHEEPDEGKVLGFDAGSPLPAETLIPGLHYQRKRDRHENVLKSPDGLDKSNNYRLYPESGLTFKAEKDYLVAHYSGGIDGKGLLAKTPKTGPTRTYCKALVPQALIDRGTPATIPFPVWKNYQDTGELLGDADRGHLAGHPGEFKNLADTEREGKRLIKEAIAETRDNLAPNQLIYVEIDTQSGKIVSFGHHFRYRWRYADSVRMLRDSGDGKPGTRPELRPLEGEGIVDRGDGIAGCLSGARLLFGYAVDATDESGNKGVGEGDCSRLAGRVSINHAIEQVDPDTWEPELRFLYRDVGGDDCRFLLPLPILGGPKPSAVEHYLDQTGVEQISGATRTYGDLPGVDSAGTALNGRKFYAHNPVEVLPGPLASNHALLADGDDTRSKQATLARFVSRPEKHFRCTLRFQDLRGWELGAVLLALQPERILTCAPNHLDPVLARYCAGVSRAKDDADPPFALKLGYGRPLGMGSVALQVCSGRVLSDTAEFYDMDEDRQKQAVVDFLKQASGRRLQLKDWLRALRWNDHGGTAYPTARPRPQDEPTIFAYHTAIRRAHSEQRREKHITTGGPRIDAPVWPDNEPWDRE